MIYELCIDSDGQVNLAGGKLTRMSVVVTEHMAVCFEGLAVELGLGILNQLGKNQQGNQLVDFGIVAAESSTVQM